MSALALKADMCGATRDVRYGSKADIGTTAGVQEKDAGTFVLAPSACP